MKTFKHFTPGKILLSMFGALIVFFLIVPTFIVIPMSFNESPVLDFPPVGFTLMWYERIFTDRMWRESLFNSLTVACASAFLATILGTSASYATTFYRFPGKRIISALIISPLIVPVVMVAIGMFMVYVHWDLTGNLFGLIFAHASLSLPFVFVTVSASLRTIDKNLESAARGLGASKWKAFQRITLPLAFPGIIAGALFSFITSWDEVVAALFLTTARVQTLPVQMWAQLSERVDPTVAAVSTLLLLVTTSLSVIALSRERKSW